MKLREYVISVFKEVYEKYGYEPLETPALEYTELMLGQSGEEAENQFYRFKDPGKRDVMLKFEVMTSMCRAVAENIGTLPIPYKRYQIQRTWRAENTQKGRYREFTQCDVDTVGSASMICDGEAIAMGIEVVEKLGFEKFEVKLNNRKILEGLVEFVEIDKDNFYGFCISLDKLEKIGKKKVIEEMTNKRGIDSKKAEKALVLVDPKKYKDKTFIEIAKSLDETVGQTKIGREGLDELLEVNEFLKTAGVDSQYYRFDVSLARGLAHYTGPVWEFVVIEGDVGSVAGGGRYDGVISDYVGRDVPATGVSFGIERICDIMKERNMLDLGTTVDVMVVLFQDDLWQETLQIADKLRQMGTAQIKDNRIEEYEGTLKRFSVMLYPEADSLSKQFRYADRKKIPWVVIAGPDELKNNEIQLKNMKSGEQKDIALQDAVKEILSD
jgi:histidyl-tRNA synthetase